MTQRELKIRHTQKRESETVLVMQGGGSLGAYECGVYKALLRQGIKFDIVSGTSIGAINAAIIAGSKNEKPDKDLEDFWIEIAESATANIIWDTLRPVMSTFYGATFGNSRVFSPAWHMSHWSSPEYIGTGTAAWLPLHLYNLSGLRDTLHRYVDFAKISATNIPRLILSCTDIKSSEPVIYDSASTRIDVDHIVACAGYPFYGIEWTKKDGKFLWDGALLSNTPLREVIDSSPKRDKEVYIVNLFPHIQEELPKNIVEVWHRARDIMHTDKTDNNLRMSRVISRHLLLMREMHDILSNAQLDNDLKERFLKIEPEYHKLAEARGAIIKDITRIERSEDAPFLFEDADFSLATIKKLIKQGENDTEKALARKQNKT